MPACCAMLATRLAARMVAADTEIALACGDDSCRHRAAQSERIAERQNPAADAGSFVGSSSHITCFPDQITEFLFDNYAVAGLQFENWMWVIGVPAPDFLRLHFRARISPEDQRSARWITRARPLHPC